MEQGPGNSTESDKGDSPEEATTKQEHQSLFGRRQGWVVVGGLFMVGLVAFFANLTTVLDNVSAWAAGAGIRIPGLDRPPVSLVVTVQNAGSKDVMIQELIECTPIESASQRMVEYPTLRAMLRGASYEIAGNQQASYRFEIPEEAGLQVLVSRGGSDLFCKVFLTEDQSSWTTWFPLQKDMIETKRMLIKVNGPQQSPP